MKNRQQYILITIKGMLMGASDIVPGVSGGTMAFITGIYERLINALGSFDAKLVRMVLHSSFKQARKHIDANFLVALVIGLAASVVVFAGLISQGLTQYPHLMYAFFAGLIIASAEMIYGHVKQRTRQKYLVGILAIGVGYMITLIAPTQLEPSYLMVFLSAAVAISAMILPGISGSFILVLLGMYDPIINALHDKDITIIAVFMAGAAVGLLSFVRVVKHLFARHHDFTIAALIGLMLGSLPKLRPWHQTDFAYFSPATTPYSTLGYILWALALGYLIVFFINKFAHKKIPATPELYDTEQNHDD